VIVIDNMFTGRQQNVQHWIGHQNFQLIIHDVVEPIMLEVDQVNSCEQTIKLFNLRSS
jgi:UDP-glucuronate decarboxylase